MYDYFLFYNNYDKFNSLYAGGSHVSKLKCLYACRFDNMFYFIEIYLFKTRAFKITVFFRVLDAISQLLHIFELDVAIFQSKRKIRFLPCNFVNTIIKSQHKLNPFYRSILVI